MTTSLALATMLSRALVAHTIELDNEAEHRLPHRITRGDDAGARRALQPLVGDGNLASSPLDRGLTPYPDNWRAAVRQRPSTLPHYPMVLHRGGYPDGS